MVFPRRWCCQVDRKKGTKVSAIAQSAKHRRDVPFRSQTTLPLAAPVAQLYERSISSQYRRTEPTNPGPYLST
ncbi:hypothetical protein NDU88_010729 [Pleurodeles waltl]|uniref:Uncharacterized protein n=1 Tax=Pleurodeles waltl TaxID=8319 RepID=A0AAV7PYR9_PLEWA|nr:hypothetical protein NDU88_010729 [Pleurodeles waltl]